MHDEEQGKDPYLRILWTTGASLGVQPIVSITVKGGMLDRERVDLLESIGEAIAGGRKRQGDMVETVVGRPCEDHVSVVANAVHFAKPSPENVVAPPAIVRWLLKNIPPLAPSGMRIEVAWMKPGTPGTRAIHVQPEGKR